MSRMVTNAVEICQVRYQGKKNCYDFLQLHCVILDRESITSLIRFDDKAIKRLSISYIKSTNNECSNAETKNHKVTP